MARIVSVRKGAGGAVHAVAEDGSLFISRDEYFTAASSAESEAWLPNSQPPFDTSDLALAVAAAAFSAEKAALSLLARAEQHRAGLAMKLSAKSFPKDSIRLALDRLETTGFLSDRRYAGAWIRQRLRRHAEGPLSLASELASRGVARSAVKDAISDELGGDEKPRIIAEAYSLLCAKGVETVDARMALARLGWRLQDIDEALAAIEP